MAVSMRILFLNFLFICSAFFSLKTFAVELIQTPKGVLIRSIPAWESIKAIEVKTEERTIRLENSDGRLQALLTEEDLCKSPVYRVTPLKKIKPIQWQSLAHLCKGDAEIDETSFLFISDTQEYHEYHKRTAQLLNKLIVSDEKKFKFIINAGDLVQTSNLKEWEKYREIASKYYTSLVPIIPVIGNHEYRKDSDRKLMKFVYGTEETQNDYYFIDMGKLVVIVLNSNISLLKPEVQQSQTAWLKQTLESFSEKTIIVAYHQPMYTSGFGLVSFSQNPGYMRDNWLPLFKEFGVRLVLSGHEHLYERSLVDDVVFINSGTAAGKLYAFEIWSTDYSKFVLPFVRTLSVLHLKDNQLHLDSYNSQSNGSIIDKLDF